MAPKLSLNAAGEVDRNTRPKICFDESAVDQNYSIDRHKSERSSKI